MKVVYVVGKFRAPTHWGVVQNVRAAEAVALEVWRAGAAALCPHLNCANFEGAVGDTPENATIWLEGDIEMMKRCDAIVLVPGWENSTGGKEEVRIAIEEGLPVFAAEGAVEDLACAGDPAHDAASWELFEVWVKSDG